MNVPKDLLMKLLSEAFDYGQRGSYECRQQDIEDIVFGFQRGKDAPWITMTAKELAQQPTGRQIYHGLFGFGVVSNKNSEKYVQFQGFRMELAEEGFPWTSKLQLVS